MRKIILILIIFICTNINKGYCIINVQSQDQTYVHSNEITRAISTISNTMMPVMLEIKVKALDQYLTNISNPNVKIPISQLFFYGGTKIYQMQYNTPVTVLEGVAVDSTYPQNFNLQIQCVKALPPGEYTTRLLFETNTLPLSPPTTFNMVFTVPVDQAISGSAADIKYSGADVFNPSATVYNTTTTQLHLKSNTNWKLIMDTTGIGTINGNYYMEILNSTPNVITRVSEPILIQPNKQYQIAKGNATVVTPISGGYANDFITARYYVQGDGKKYPQSGTITNNITFTMQTNN